MEELKKAYRAGITSIVLTIVFSLLLVSLVYVSNNFAILIVNVISFIVLTLVLAFYFKMMMGYVNIGEKYSNKLKKSIYWELSCIIIAILILIILFFARIEQSTLFVSILSLLLILIYLIFAIVKIVSGIAVYKIPVKSNTKSTLSIFSMLFGISMIIPVGLFFLPYIKIMEIVFQILFLKDTYEKDHKDKKARNLWWWIASLIIYLILIGVVGYLMYSFLSFWKEFL